MQPGHLAGLHPEGWDGGHPAPLGQISPKRGQAQHLVLCGPNPHVLQDGFELMNVHLTIAVDVEHRHQMIEAEVALCSAVMDGSQPSTGCVTSVSVNQHKSPQPQCIHSYQYPPTHPLTHPSTHPPTHTSILCRVANVHDWHFTRSTSLTRHTHPRSRYCNKYNAPPPPCASNTKIPIIDGNSNYCCSHRGGGFICGAFSTRLCGRHKVAFRWARPALVNLSKRSSKCDKNWVNMNGNFFSK